MTLTDAAEEFLLALRADGMSEKTIIWYRTIVTNTFVQTRPLALITTISASAMRTHLAALQTRYSSESTLHAHRRALHRFWRWCAVEYGVENPMRNIAYGQQPRPGVPKAVSVFDAVRMLDVCGDDRIGIRDRALIAVLLDTGARSGGVCGLLMSSLDTSRMRALVTEKGRKSRTIHWTETTAALLERWLLVRDHTETVFHTARGAALTPNTLLQMHYRRADAAGVRGRCNPHSFRHGFAREYLLNGGDLATLSRILGHSDVSVTAAFYSVFTTDELAAAHHRYSPMHSANRVLNWREFEPDLRESG